MSLWLLLHLKCLNECECCECAYVSFYVFFSFSVSVDCPGSEDEDDPAVEGVTGLVPVLAIEDGESSTHMSLEKEIAIIAEYKRALLSAGYDSSSASSLYSENGEKNSEFQLDFNYDHDDGNQHPEEIFFFP